MANSRELAEQAFTLLQNALSESEARASDLDDQLKRKRQPKNRLEEQLDVLTHRIENVEAERARWEHQAGHLEEVAEAERVKVAQLKKKLEIAESGPEKLTKKEINFWRAKAEAIDTEIQDYKTRLAALRRDLNERDELIEKLRAGGAALAAEPAPAHDGSDDAAGDLKQQLEQRDRWLAELRLDLHELRAQPATAPLETEAAVETLRGQVAALERALADAHNQRAAAQADLGRTAHDLAERERAIREAMATSDRAREALAEREHRLVELSAEVEHLRNDLRQRDEQERATSVRHDEQVAALTRDLNDVRGRIEHDRHDAVAARSALELALHERERENDKQRELLAANESDFRELHDRLAQRDAEIEEHRRELGEREQSTAAVRREVEDLRRELAERGRALDARSDELRDLGRRLAEREAANGTSAAELEDARANLAASSAEIERLRDTIQSTSREIEHARVTLTNNERDLASLRDTLLGSSRELDELRAHRQRLEAALADGTARADAAASELAAAREQIAGLEGELKEEHEHAENLGEIANERREHMTKLQEQVEEADERLAEANWKLGKSLHFERIVKRRKGLVLKLLEALRSKMKSNVALKAGIDGLRTFKASAEMNQQKLLKRIDALKAEVIEAEEAVKRHQSGTAAKQELANALAHARTLEERLNTQAELIQSLEADLKTARLAQKPGDDKSAEMERLAKELETKNQIIERFEADIDEQQRKLSKLRGSESETVRLKALTEKDRSEIEALQHEVIQLREALARQAGIGNAEQAAGAHNTELEARLKEREQSVTRLMGTIKEHEATIKKLTESADGWKRKYQFLAADAPDAYKSTAEK